VVGWVKGELESEVGMREGERDRRTYSFIWPGAFPLLAFLC
jgi:hypothetical protein